MRRGLRKNGPFLSFAYVCLEPVLVKCSFIYINGSKRPFLLTGRRRHDDLGIDRDLDIREVAAARQGCDRPAVMSVRPRVPTGVGGYRLAADLMAGGW